MGFLIDLNGLILLAAFLINFGLSLFIYWQNRKNATNQVFSLLIVCIALWVLASFFSDRSADYQTAIFWNRFIFFIAAIIPIFSVLFAIYFPEGGSAIGALERPIVIVTGTVLALGSLFTDLVVKKINYVAWGTTIDFGPLNIVHSLYLVAFLGYAFYRLARKYYRFQGTHRMQIKYVFLGCLMTAVLAVLTNVILPILGIFQLTGLGPAFTLILVGFTTYAIIKHRLMSIEIIIQRGTIYAVVTALIIGFYALAIIVSETYFRKLIGYTSFIFTTAITLLIAILYQPLVRGFQSLTDRIFFRGRYDYQKTLRLISQQIASVIKLEELTRLIVSSFVDTMKVSEISFLYAEKEGEHFKSVPISAPRYKRIEIDVASPIIFWLSYSKDILVRDEVEDEISRLKAIGKEGEGERNVLEQVRDEMERLGISIWVPIISQEKPIGIIALGDKLSGDIYTNEDLILLNTLANQAAVALDNSRLYDEVVSIKNYNEEILQSMTNGVLTTDTRGRVITFNQMAERISGRKAEAVVGKGCEEIWGKRGSITLAVEDALKDRPGLNLEANIASPERGLVPVAFSSTLLRDDAGKKLGALLSIQDLSEIKELEDKVRRADKLQALATMAAGMAHEIKNPLSSMKVFAQLLPQKYEDPEYRQKLEEVLRREIDRIDRIVESLLGFTRATVPVFEKMKIDEILEKTVKDFEDQAKNAGVKIIKSYADLPPIEVDKNQISQVFSNLVLNAIQAMPEGGELAITTSPGKKTEEILQNIKIRISDTGHGIAEDTQKKLFDPFFTTKYGGTGLGLTITHSIVDGHKGYIDLESRIGQGTAFTVTLPTHQ